MRGSAVQRAGLVACAWLLCACGGDSHRVAVGDPAALETQPAMFRASGEHAHGGHDPGAFATHVRREADAIELDVVRDVRRGDLTSMALTDVRARRAYIERMLSQYGADGFIHRDERHHVDALIQGMRDAKGRYARAFGGGP